MDWSWTPKITINEIELGNASWGSRPEMFTLDRAQVSLGIPDLFKGHLVLPEIRVSKPRLLLEKNAEGKANWDFGIPPEDEEKKPAGPPISRRWFPKIDRLTIDDGKLVFRDPASHTELDMNVSNVVGASNEQALESRRSRIWRVTSSALRSRVDLHADLPSEGELTVYRLVQEALTNIAKYARARRV